MSPEKEHETKSHRKKKTTKQKKNGRKRRGKWVSDASEKTHVNWQEAMGGRDVKTISYTLVEGSQGRIIGRRAKEPYPFEGETGVLPFWESPRDMYESKYGWGKGV